MFTMLCTLLNFNLCRCKVQQWQVMMKVVRRSGGEGSGGRGGGCGSGDSGCGVVVVEGRGGK